MDEYKFKFKSSDIYIELKEYPICQCGGQLVPITSQWHTSGKLELSWKCTKCNKKISK